MTRREQDKLDSFILAADELRRQLHAYQARYVASAHARKHWTEANIALINYLKLRSEIIHISQ